MRLIRDSPVATVLTKNPSWGSPLLRPRIMVETASWTYGQADMVNAVTGLEEKRPEATLKYRLE